MDILSTTLSIIYLRDKKVFVTPLQRINNHHEKSLRFMAGVPILYYSI
jgi:hypothetical protein